MSKSVSHTIKSIGLAPKRECPDQKDKHCDNKSSKLLKPTPFGTMLRFWVPREGTDNIDVKNHSVHHATAAVCNAIQAPIITSFMIHDQGTGNCLGVVDNAMRVLLIHGMIAGPSPNESLEVDTYTEREIIFDNITLSRIENNCLVDGNCKKIEAKSRIYWRFDGDKREALNFEKTVMPNFRYVRNECCSPNLRGLLWTKSYPHPIVMLCLIGISSDASSNGS